ncbi:MAG: glycosyltransferase family 2 protein [Bacilli bacterium]|nr:glycosyltransferase family 2 protein [Bacilli bacterium]
MKDLVSIIIPVYNAEKFIDETINTVLNQTYTNWELLLVNDCSTDNSVKLIQKYLKDERIKLINNKVNSKAAVSRNNGIKKAKGRYICFLDADDLWDKEKLEKQVKFMNKKDCAFSFTGYEFADENGKPNGKKVFIPETITYKQALKNTTIWTSTVMFDMNKLSKENIYMPNIKSEDTASWWSILKKIDKAYGLNEILSFYRRTEGTLSSNKFEAIKRIWNLYRNVEHLNIFYSFYCFCFYALRAVRRRV